MSLKKLYCLCIAVLLVLLFTLSTTEKTTAQTVVPQPTGVPAVPVLSKTPTAVPNLSIPITPTGTPGATTVPAVPPLDGIPDFGSFSAETNQSKSGDKKTLPEVLALFDTFIAPYGTDNPFPELIPKDRELLGWLTVNAEVKPELYTYATTQKAGGYPTKIQVTSSVSSPKTDIFVGIFIPCSPIHPEDFYGNVLEKMKGDITWIAPVTIPKSANLTPERRADLAKSLRISGVYDGLICSAGENGICNPVKLPFTAEYAPSFKETAALLADAVKHRVSAPKTTSDTVSSVDKSASETKTSGDSKTASSKIDSSNQSGSSLVQEDSGFTIWVPIFAFLGGLILNVMPCVLPVIGLKIITFFQQAGQSRSLAFRLNLWYTFGILTVFLVLAFMSVGLSYLFTYGLFQIIMCLIVFAMALNLMGIWEIKLPEFLGGKKSNELMEQEGAGGAFFKGIITTLLAIPCGAPLLSPTLAWTNAMIRQGDSAIVIPIYLLIGLGMASPFLIMGARPELLRFLPKPGEWMENFRNIMGFFLLTAVIWIIFSMPTAAWILPMMTLLFALWFVCWFLGSTPFDATTKTRLRRWTVSILLLAATALLSFNIPGVTMPFTIESAVEAKMTRWAIRAQREGRLELQHWKLFHPAEFEKMRSEGKTIIIDFTADWCPNCKVLENTILHTESFLKLTDEKGILTYTADCTNQSAETTEMQAINKLLDTYGGRQVPTIMIFRPGQERPDILRGLFTRAAIEELLK